MKPCIKKLLRYKDFNSDDSKTNKIQDIQRALKLELQFNRYIIITRYNTKYIKRSKPVHGNHYFNNIILYNIQIQY